MLERVNPREIGTKTSRKEPGRGNGGAPVDSHFCIDPYNDQTRRQIACTPGDDGAYRCRYKHFSRVIEDNIDKGHRWRWNEIGSFKSVNGSGVRVKVTRDDVNIQTNDLDTRCYVIGNGSKLGCISPGIDADKDRYPCE
jgi:hypothetical protein